MVEKKKAEKKRLLVSVQRAAANLQSRIEAVKSLYGTPTSLRGILTGLEKKADAPRAARKARKVSKKPKKITITIS